MYIAILARSSTLRAPLSEHGDKNRSAQLMNRANRRPAARAAQRVGVASRRDDALATKPRGVQFRPTVKKATESKAVHFLNPRGVIALIS